MGPPSTAALHQLAMLVQKARRVSTEGTTWSWYFGVLHGHAWPGWVATTSPPVRSRRGTPTHMGVARLASACSMHACGARWSEVEVGMHAPARLMSASTCASVSTSHTQWLLCSTMRSTSDCAQASRCKQVQAGSERSCKQVQRHVLPCYATSCGVLCCDERVMMGVPGCCLLESRKRSVIRTYKRDGNDDALPAPPLPCPCAWCVGHGRASPRTQAGMARPAKTFQ